MFTTLPLPVWHALLREVCRSILRAGFKRILLVNSHGGNVSALNALTVDLSMELDAKIATTTLYAIAHDSGAYAKILESQKVVMHACEAETSMMMAIAPDCVRMDKLADAHGPDVTRETALARPLHIWKSFTEMTPTGVVGDGRKGTPAKGEILLDVAAQSIADLLIKGEPWR